MTREEQILKRNMMENQILKKNADGDGDTDTGNGDTGDGDTDTGNGDAGNVVLDGYVGGSDTYSPEPKPVKNIKDKLIEGTDKLGVTNGGDLRGFIWGILIGAVIVWQWSNIVKFTKSFGKNN